MKTTIEESKLSNESETARKIKRCNQLGIPGNLTLLEYLESLEKTIEQLKSKVKK